jgi:hypothetical protein
MRSEMENKAALSQKAVDKAVEQRQTAEAATAQLQEVLQQEQQKTAALTQEAKAAQAVTTGADPERRAAVSTIADLPSPQQENQQTQVASEVPRKLNALAKFSRQQSGKAASNQTIEDVKAELKPSVRQSRAQIKGIKPSANTTGTTETEQPVSSDEEASEAGGLLARARALIVQGNIIAARSVLERAAETGSTRAIFALAETYDPNVLATWRTRGTRADVTRARDLYVKAHEGGLKAAKDRADSLAIGNREQKPASWFGRE